MAAALCSTHALVSRIVIAAAQGPRRALFPASLRIRAKSSPGPAWRMGKLWGLKPQLGNFRLASARHTPETSGGDGGDHGSGHGGGGHGGDGRDRKKRTGESDDAHVGNAAVLLVAALATAGLFNFNPKTAHAHGGPPPELPDDEPKTHHHPLEEWFESALFSTRFFVFAAVLGSVTMAGLMFLKGSTEVASSLLSMLMRRHHSVHGVVFQCIEALENYMTGTILLVFGMGMYELFISRIEIKRKSEIFFLDQRPRFLKVNGLNDLKMKLGSIINMLMVMQILQSMIKVVDDAHPSGVTTSEMLNMSGTTLMVALSLAIMNQFCH